MMDKYKLLNILDIGLTEYQKSKLIDFLNAINEDTVKEYNSMMNNEGELTGNIYNFDGLYDGQYIRLESNNVKELLNTLNKLYK